MDQTNNSSHKKWVPLTSSALFMLRHGKLMVLSLFLFILTLGITWLCYHVSIGFVDNLTGDFFLETPQTITIWGWTKHKGWLLLKWLFLISTRIIAFYLAFLTAYCLTTPGYVILSTATEKYQAGMKFDITESTTLKGLLIDLKEGIKIGVFGIIITLFAFICTFLPGIGQILAFLMYTYYSALMFIDFPTSNRRWSLREKLLWLRRHKAPAFRLGLLPALMSMIPLLNIFLMALLFPLLTVHTTLNFASLTTNSEGQS